MVVDKRLYSCPVYNPKEEARYVSLGIMNNVKIIMLGLNSHLMKR